MIHHPFRLAPIAVVAWCVIGSMGASAADEQARPCQAQLDITRLARPLPRTAQRLASDKPLTIVALGSSSTAGAGASSPAASYPSRLEIALRERFPGHPITVLNRGVNGEEARDVLDRFERSVIAEKADLVLWQVGTNSVLRDHSVATAGAVIRQGVARLRALGIDVVLIDPQFAPRVLAKPQVEDMVGLIAATAKQANVDLFPRFAVMRHWRENESLPFESFLSPDQLHMNDWSYACIAKLIGASIGDAASRQQAIAGTTLTSRIPPTP